MMREERINWVVNIENAASYIASVIGEEVVESALYKFGAGSIEDISDSDLSDIFGELYANEADLRSD